jgi:hypothetical protein
LILAPNKDKPHIFVLPEDDANIQLANGFHLNVAWNKYRQMQVLKAGGGWLEVLNAFETEHLRQMEHCTNRFLVLLIDFDGKLDRFDNAKERIPETVADRVFILGVLTEPEELRAALGDYETIGRAMADDCRDGTDVIWSHELLRHNVTELNRLRRLIRQVLF